MDHGITLQHLLTSFLLAVGSRFVSLWFCSLGVELASIGVNPGGLGGRDPLDFGQGRRGGSRRGRGRVVKYYYILSRAVKSCQKTHPGNRSRQDRLTVYT